MNSLTLALALGTLAGCTVPLGAMIASKEHIDATIYATANSNFQ